MHIPLEIATLSELAISGLSEPTILNSSPKTEFRILSSNQMANSGCSSALLQYWGRGGTPGNKSKHLSFHFFTAIQELP